MPALNQSRTTNATSFRLSPRALEIVAQLKQELGFANRDDIIELALRELARKWDISLPENELTQEEINAAQEAFDRIGKEPEYDLEETERWAAKYVTEQYKERARA